MENSSTLILFFVIIIACAVSFALAVFFCCRADSRTITTIRNTARYTENTFTIAGIISEDIEKDTIGLDPSVIESFHIIPYQSVKKLKHVKGRHGCAVCLSEFENDDMLRILPGCCHVFHPSCIGTWLVCHVTCPICRSDLSDPAVLASKHCLIGRERDVVMTEMMELESDDRMIRRSASLVGRWPGRSSRWDESIKTLSSRWRNEGESKRIVPMVSGSHDTLSEVNMGSSNARENNIV